MLVSWVAQAWDNLHKYNSNLIRQTFTDLGLSLPTDGSRDKEIKIKDLPNVEVGDWKNWTPTQGCKQPFNNSTTRVEVPKTPWINTIMTNKTLKEVERLADEAEQADDAVQDDSDSDNSGIE